MTYIFPCSGSSSNSFGDKSCCSVHALVNAFEMKFEEAQKLTFRYGRKKDDGMYVTSFARLLKEQFEILVSGIYGSTQKAYELSRDFRQTRQKGISLKRFIDTHSTGTFILFTRGHFSVVKDGKLMNSYAMLPGTSVVGVWKV